MRGCNRSGRLGSRNWARSSPGLKSAKLCRNQGLGGGRSWQIAGEIPWRRAGCGRAGLIGRKPLQRRFFRRHVLLAHPTQLLASLTSWALLASPPCPLSLGSSSRDATQDLRCPDRHEAHPQLSSSLRVASLKRWPSGCCSPPPTRKQTPVMRIPGHKSRGRERAISPGRSRPPWGLSLALACGGGRPPGPPGTWKGSCSVSTHYETNTSQLRISVQVEVSRPLQHVLVGEVAAPGEPWPGPSAQPIVHESPLRDRP